MGHEREPIFVGPQGKDSRSAVELEADIVPDFAKRSNNKRTVFQWVAPMVDQADMLTILMMPLAFLFGILCQIERWRDIKKKVNLC